MIDYSKRLVEVDVILKHLSKSDYDKIPEEIKIVIRENKDKEYEWKYDKTKKLKEQNVSDDTIAILSYINMEYLLNDEQKEFVGKLHEINNKNNFNMKDIKEKEYSYKELFENKKKSIKTESEELKRTEILEYKESFLRKIINKIKRIFNK